jgi:hypothetical protein
MSYSIATGSVPDWRTKQRTVTSLSSGFARSAPYLDGLVGIARKGAGIRAHEELLELPRQLVLLLRASAAPAGPHRHSCDAAEVEVRDDLVFDQGRKMAPVALADGAVGLDRRDHLVGNLPDQRVGRGRLRESRMNNEERGERAEQGSHGVLLHAAARSSALRRST